LQLDLLLTDTGYKPTTNQRFRIYLTNSLEEHHQDTGTLFANWLSTEANEANHIKRDTPVMCVIGNPPYSGESANKGEWIMKLMEDYKKEPGGKEKLKETNSKWINADEYKFIRFGQHFIDKNGTGVLAFINPHNFLDNPTFRGMRWSLLNSFDKIYTIDLHGNSTKKEVSPDGSVDQNVFDIMQGVSINLFVKTGKKKSNELGQVFHYDLYGKRESKYEFLNVNTIKTILYEKLLNIKPDYYFKQKDLLRSQSYETGLSIKDLFTINGVGLCSKKDSIVFHDKKNDLENLLSDFNDLDVNEIKVKYKIQNESNGWKVILAKENIKKFGVKKEFIKKCLYRPFEIKYTYHTNYNMGFLARPVYNNMRHLSENDNIGLCFIRNEQGINKYNHVFISNNIVDLHLFSSVSGCIASPLYIYPESKIQQSIQQKIERTSNLNQEVVNEIAKKLGLTFVCEKKIVENTFAPIDILDYVYAILHSPTYREKYLEFLKMDFPRVPYPKDAATFWQLVKLGGEIRQIHLLESAIVDKYITQYPIDGNNTVGKPKYQDGKVYINDTQYFDNVPQIAWEFYIGGYQPAQKWLKDRKERKLEFDDILHYQKIIVALSETDRLMKEIDKIEIE